MEFVEGESLRRVLNRLGALTVRKGIELVGQVCDAFRKRTSRESFIVISSLKI